MDIKYFDDFCLGGIKLSEFNGIKYNPSGGGIDYDTMPSPRHTTMQLPNMDGEKYIKTVYDTRLIKVPVFLYDTIDIDRFNAWIGKNEEQTFCYVNNIGEFDYKEIDVIYNKGIDITQYYTPDFRGMSTLEFIAFNPLWRVRDERKIVINSPVLNKINTFYTNTTIISKPLVIIYPNGNQNSIKFQFNNLMISLKNINKEIYIDSYNGEVYEENNGVKNNMIKKYYSNGWYEMPKIKPFDINKIILIEGNVSKIEIVPNSRIL